MKHPVFFTLFVFSFATLAQSPNYVKASTNVQSILNPNTQSSVVRPFDNRNRGVYGVPTLSEEYVPGELIMQDGKTYAMEKMNYDAYEDQLLVISSGQESIVSAQVVRAFKLKMPMGERFFERHTESTGAYGYYQKIVEANGLTIYKKIVKKLNQPSSQETFASGKTYSEFLSAEKLYFANRPAELAEVKNKKSLLSLYEEIKVPLEKFLKEESINLKSEADLMKLAKFIETQVR